MKKYAILIFVICLAATTANAQFRIKIPKIKIPQIETPTTEDERLANEPVNQPVQPQAQPATATATRSTAVQPAKSRSKAHLLDSMTFFRLDEHRENHKVVGWVMYPNLQLQGDIPNRSGLRIFVKKNGKELINFRCEIKEEFAWQCYDKTKVVKEIGLLDVEVNFINGDSDEETPLRKYKIDVHRTERFNGFAHFFVNRHPDAAVAYLSFEGKNPWVMRSRSSKYKGSSRLWLNTVIFRDEAEKYLGGYYLRCKVNGQPFKLKKSDVHIGQDEGSVFAVYESKHLTGNRKGSVYKDYLKGGPAEIQIPLSMGSEDSHSNDVSKNPGNWECTITSQIDREIIRIFRFTIDAGGQIVPHPEQQNGNVVFGDWEWMIDMDIPPGGSPIDHRLKRFPEMGFFHGIPWTTPEGKVMAERVPNKGNPFPLPAK